MSKVAACYIGHRLRTACVVRALRAFWGWYSISFTGQEHRTNCPKCFSGRHHMHFVMGSCCRVSLQTPTAQFPCNVSRLGAVQPHNSSQSATDALPSESVTDALAEGAHDGVQQGWSRPFTLRNKCSPSTKPTTLSDAIHILPTRPVVTPVSSCLTSLTTYQTTQTYQAHSTIHDPEIFMHHSTHKMLRST